MNETHHSCGCVYRDDPRTPKGGLRAARPVFALKLNDDGSPAHPLYQPKNALPFEYRWEP